MAKPGCGEARRALLRFHDVEFQEKLLNVGRLARTQEAYTGGGDGKRVAPSYPRTAALVWNGAATGCEVLRRRIHEDAERHAGELAAILGQTDPHAG